jgi:uncharacterized protein
MAHHGPQGRFVWHELLTPDGAGAQRFYTTTLGWSVENAAEDPVYSMFASSNGPCAGSVEQPPNAVPQWVPYVMVADLDEAIRRAGELGASVTTEPTTMKHGGRYAVLADPHGATFGLYSANEGDTGDAEPSEFSWHELATPDYHAALDFYRELFDWEVVAEHDMGPLGTYLVFGRDGKQLGGMFNKGDSGKPGPAYWLSYVRVDDLKGTLERMKGAHGSVVVEPMEVPGGDRIAQLIDPYGALVALHATARDATSADSGRGRPKPAEVSVTDVWTSEPSAQEATDDPAEQESAPRRRQSASKPSRKRARKAPAKKKAGSQRSKKATKAASASGTKAKKGGAKKAAKKKAAAGKKSAKKSGSKAGKKAAAKKTTKKAAKKVAKKASNRPAGKKAKEKTKKKSAKAQVSKKRGAKKAGKKKSARQKPAKTNRSKAKKRKR